MEAAMLTALLVGHGVAKPRTEQPSADAAGRAALRLRGAGNKEKVPTRNADKAPCALCHATRATSWWACKDDKGVRRWCCDGKRVNLRTGQLQVVSDQRHKKCLKVKASEQAAAAAERAGGLDAVAGAEACARRPRAPGR